MATADVLLDGELIVGAGRLTDFYRLAGRLARPSRRRNSESVTFAAFDVLALEELPLTRPYVAVPRYAGTDLDHLLSACAHQGMEGVMSKRLRSRYPPGERSRDCAKVKCAGWRDHLERPFSDRLLEVVAGSPLLLSVRW